MTTTPGFLRAVGLALLILPATALAATTPAEHFDKGVADFKAGSFQEAVRHFEAARSAGMRSPSLRYNLGVAYYHLGKLQRARSVFRELAKDPDEAALAHYNLGLIARKLDGAATARDHFRSAFRVAEDEQIRRLAEERLEELRVDREPGREQSVDPFSGLVSAALGFSDNVTLAPDEIVSTSDTDDWLLEGLAAGTFQAAGDSDAGLQLKASAYSVRYADLDAFNQDFLRLGPELDLSLGAWATDLAAYHDWVYLDGDLFERVATAEIDTHRPVGPAFRVRMRYRFSRIAGEDGFDYLSGDRHRLNLEGRLGTGPWTGRLGYELELNDREDLDLGQEFISASPTRHEISGRLGRDLGALWRGQVRAAYRLSRYPDPNVEQTTSGLVKTTREDSKLRLGIRFRRELPWWRLRAFGEFERTRNNSSIDSYDYRANVYTAGLERLF